jgi:predicted nucleic acid-binding protein
MVVLLDTNILFASASARDAHHTPAREIIRGIDHGDLPKAILTNYVVAETLNLTREKLGPDAANGMLDRLIEGTHFELVTTPQSDFNASQAVFRRYPELSFVDATIVAYMQRNGIEYLYSFDDDFDAVSDISRIESADNPFN